MSCGIFFPVSSRDDSSTLRVGQRYRHPFGDKRIDRRIRELSSEMVAHQSVVINRLSDNRSQKSGFYNVLNKAVGFLWFRPSGTEPLLRLMVEIETKYKELFPVLFDFHKNLLIKADQKKEKNASRN